MFVYHKYISQTNLFALYHLCEYVTFARLILLFTIAIATAAAALPHKNVLQSFILNTRIHVYIICPSFLYDQCANKKMYHRRQR